MALIKCEECTKDVSDKAAACPHCGAPIKPAIDPSIAHLLPKEPVKVSPGDRRCLSCGYVGQMKTWLRNYNAPQFITLILLFFWVIPGLVFVAWGWGKHKCPRCGKLANSVPE